MSLLGTPFGSEVRVSRDPRVLQVSAERTLGSLLDQMEAEAPDWVVVFRAHGAAPNGRYLYAFRPHEILGIGLPRSEALGRALDLREHTSSGLARSGRPVEQSGGGGQSGGRFVELDPFGTVVAIVEKHQEAPPASAPAAIPPARGASWQDEIIKNFSIRVPPSRDDHRPDAHWGAEAAEEEEQSAAADDGDGGWEPAPAPSWSETEDEDEPLDVGPERVASSPPPAPFRSPTPGSAATAARPSPAPATIDLTLSASAPAEARVATEIHVSWLVERSEFARPLAHRISAAAEPQKPLVILLTMQGAPVELIGESFVQVAPPGPQSPAAGFFRLRAVGAGQVRMEIAFLQNGRQLGSIGLALEIVEDAPRKETTARRVTAQPRGGEDMLLLKIGGVSRGDAFHYEYFLYGQRLGLVWKFESAPLLDAGNGRARTEIDFVHRIYDRVSPELRTRADLEVLNDELRRLGRFLCAELFPIDALRLLWPLRDRIGGIQIVSFEPYIPWELLRLENPDTQELDDRFLAEYSLVRTVAGLPAAQALGLGDWRFLFAEFPMKSLSPVGQSERAFFTDPDPALAAAAGSLAPIALTRDALLQTLSEGNFDVLHLSCHAESDHSRIDSARLVIGDQPGPGGAAEQVAVDTVAVHGEARLRRRAPLVFLNACETGRAGAVLTSWGGWPKVFMERGAGAFVGASWPVRDKPATAFSTTFYHSLLSGHTLAEAAQEARLAAKASGDASWLAYKVYGDPLARKR